MSTKDKDWKSIAIERRKALEESQAQLAAAQAQLAEAEGSAKRIKTLKRKLRESEEARTALDATVASQAEIIAGFTKISKRAAKGDDAAAMLQVAEAAYANVVTAVLGAMNELSSVIDENSEEGEVMLPSAVGHTNNFIARFSRVMARSMELEARVQTLEAEKSAHPEEELLNAEGAAPNAPQTTKPNEEASAGNSAGRNADTDALAVRKAAPTQVVEESEEDPAEKRAAERRAALA